MAQELDFEGSRGPVMVLKDLLAHFNILIPNLHTIGNDATATLMAAVLLILKHGIHPNASDLPPDVVQGRSISDVVANISQLCELTPAPS